MTNAFSYEGGELRCEGASIRALAGEVQTPAYVYSKASLLARYDEIAEAFAPLEPLICYSVKALSNLSVLRLFQGRGAGFDVVSGGELYRVMRIEGDPQKVVFAGVGKTDEELRFALRKGIFCFNVESEPELRRISELAHETGKRARVALRLNPDVDPKTHRYTATGKRETKFGVDLDRARRWLEEARGLPGIEVSGLHMHIGSQITDPEPYRLAIGKLMAFVDERRAEGVELSLVNLGGGVGIDYEGKGDVPPVSAFAEVLKEPVRTRGLKLILEPGRYIAGPSGALITRVTYVKEGGDGRRFVITDAGMHNLMRPALYGAYHRIWPVEAGGAEGEPGAPETIGPADIVGPICESGDFFAKDRPFPEVKAGDLIAIFSAGAYGFTMASQYNAHPRPPEVLVDGSRWEVVRRRERFEDLVAHEG